MKPKRPVTALHPVLAHLGRQVRSERLTRGWSIKELAAASDLSERFIHDIESGKGNVSVVRLGRISTALQVPLAAWFGHADAVRERKVIALLGLRGAGKSTVGPKLASRLSLPFFELDGLIEAAAGLTLAEIFALHGESYYRRLEADTLKTFLAETRGAVLATGGGIVASPEAFDMLSRACRLVWLKSKPEDYLERVMKQGDERHMGNNPQAMVELKNLLRHREPLYARAHHTVDTSALGVTGAVQRLAQEITAARSSE